MDILKRLAVIFMLLVAAQAQSVWGGHVVLGGGLNAQANPRLSITTQSLPDGTVNAAYSQTIGTLNGTAPLTFSINSGALPTNLFLNASTGAITGTPAQAGTYHFVIRVADSSFPTQQATRSFTITIGCFALSIGTPFLPGGVTSTPYNFTMQAVGGTPPFAWSVVSGALPAGIGLAINGVLSGTPTTVQQTSALINVRDSCFPVPQDAANTFTINIISTLVITTNPSLPQATEGASYSAQVSAVGGTTPYSWSVASGTLPAGLSLSSGGVLSGTPTAAGTSSFTLRVTDNAAATTTQPFTLVVACTPLSITSSATLANGLVGTAYSQQLTSSGGTGSVTWAVTSGALPAGVTLSSAGLISGVPTQNGNFTIGITATDSCNPTPQAAQQTFTLHIGSQVDITTTSPLPGATVGQGYSVQLNATGGTLPYIWSASVPAGLAISAAGVISGTPTASGQFTVPVQVVDAGGLTDSTSLALQVNCPALVISTVGPLPIGTVGVPYSFQFSGSGGVPPLIWGIPPSGPSTPPGLGLSSAGVLSGVPTTAGSFQTGIALNDSCSPVSQQIGQQFPITIISQLAIITTSPLPAATEGVAYSVQMAAAGGTAPYTWAVTAGGLPTGLSISSGGLISGTPTASGTFTATIRVQDVGAAHSVSGSFVTTVTCLPLSISTGATLQPGTQGVAYSQQLQSSGGTGAKTWSVIAGTLPAGVTLSSGGLLAGTPTSSGTFTPTIQVQDSCAPTTQKVTRQFSLTISTPVQPLVIVTTSPLPSGVEGQAYTFQMQAAGGTSPYTWSIIGNGLPSGLSLSSGGSITGTPTAAGTFNVKIRLRDAVSHQVTTTFRIVISCVPLAISTGSTLQSGTTGIAYSQQLQATGGNGALSWSLVGGALPTGLTLSSGGVISGTPTTAGNFSPQIQVRDSCNPTPQTTSQTFSISIAQAINPLAFITSSPLPDGTEGQAYSFSMQATGGVVPYTWTVIGGALPTGLSLSSGGAITGTPTAAGTFSATIQVADSASHSISSAFSVTISCVPLAITSSASLQDGTRTVAYSQQLQASGGNGALTWSLIGGSLPTGLSLSSGGAITGTPTASGTFNPQIQVQDSCSPTPQTTSQTFTLVINEPVAPLTIVSTTPLPGATEGQAYSFQMQASGGTPAYTWSIASGSLPTGLSISSGGSITGTPTLTGTSTPTIRVTDSLSVTTTKAFSITVSCVALAISTGATLQSGTQGVAYSQQLQATGGTGSLTWSLVSGSLPGGVSLSASGVISGTPTATGTFSPQIRVSDSCAPTAQTQTRTFSITINPAIQPLVIISTSPLPPATEGTAYSFQMQATGGAPGYTWAITAGSLPTGLTLSAGGLISGTPAATGTSTPTIRVTDTASTSTSGTFSITVSCVPLTITSNATLQGGTQNIAYSQQLQSAGGNGTKTWSLVSGSLPTGVTLSSAGLISGTPSNTGTFSPQIRVTDSCSPTPQTATQTFSLTIATAVSPLAFVTSSPLPPATESQPYGFSMQATGGVTPYTWTIVSGSLPTGLSLSSGGAISGTPTAAGTFNPIIKVTDSAATNIQSTFSITVSCVPLVLTSANIQLSDTFSSGSLGASWVIDTGTAPGNITGVNSGTFSAANVDLSQGALDLAVTQSGAAPVISVGAEVRSANTFGFGTYDFYARASSTADSPNDTGAMVSGQITGLFNICNNAANPASCPTYTEIDHEVEGQFPTQLESTNWISTTVRTTSNSTQSGMDTGFHHYSFVWQAGQVVFYFDGTVVGTHTTNVPSSPAFVLFNHWGTNSTSFGGTATVGAIRHLFVKGFTYSAITALPTATQGAAYSFQLTSTGGTGAKTWSVISGALPTGITLSSAGLLSGTPTVNGNFTATIQVQDSCAPTTQKSFAVFTITVTSSLAILTTSPLPNATMGQVYSTQLSAAGGTPPYAWSILSGALPLSFKLASGGTITGGPCTSLQTFQLGAPPFSGLTGANTVVARPENNGTNCFLDNALVRVTDAATNPARPNVTYTADAGGSGDENHWNTDDTLLCMQETGTSSFCYSFNPTTMQAARLYVSSFPATNGLTLNTGSTEFSYQNSQLLYAFPGSQITSYDFTNRTTPPTATVVYDFKNCSVLGSSFTPTWTAVGGVSKLPADALFAAGYSTTGNQGTGVIVAIYKPGSGCSILNTGNGTVRGDWGVNSGTVGITDRFTLHNVNFSKDGQWAVIQWTTCLVAPCNSGSFPYLWQVGTNNLTRLCQAGQLCGGHFTEGTSHFVNANNGPIGQFAQRLFSSTASPTAIIQTFPSPGPTPPFDDHINWSNADASDNQPFFDTVVSPTTPFPSAWYNELRAITRTGQVARIVHTFANPASHRFSTAQAIASCSQTGNFCTVSSDMMGGLGSEAGAATCTEGTNCRGDVFVAKINPETTGTYSATIQVADSAAHTASRAFTLTLGCPTLSITSTSPLASGTQNSAYAQQLLSAGGYGPVLWAVTSGSLPAGLVLSPGGLVSGTPTGTGASTATITATDQCRANAQTAARAFSITISAQVQPLVITTTSPLPAGTQAVAYATNMAATGGVAPYTWSRTAGTLPTGLSISSGGAITGTPTTIGTFTSTLQVADSAAHATSGSFAITISCVPLVLTTTSPLPSGTINVAYSQQLQSTGGTGAKTWSLTAGAFPTGVTVSSGGLISGTPSSSGAFTPTIQVADVCSTPQTASRQFALDINSSPLTIVTASPLPSGGLNSPYSVTLQAAGGTLPYAWSVTVGTLPTGLSMAGATGVISGTPTVAATTTFTVQVADSAAHTATKQFTVTFPAHTVRLNWTASPTSGVTYNVKRSTVSGGPYATIQSGVGALTYLDQTVQPCTNYFYVASAVSGAQQSANSNQASAPVPCDMLSLMLFTNRATQSLGGTWSYLDGDSALTATAGPKLWFIKTITGGPGWDVFDYDSNFVYQKLTENGDEAPTDGHAWKRFLTPPQFAPRSYVLDTTATLLSPGTNQLRRTINCELDSEPLITLGHIKNVITTRRAVAWGGNVGTRDTILVSYFWGGTDPSTVYNTLEEFWLVPGLGRVQWDTNHWNGTTYINDQTVTHNTIVASSLVQPNFPCGFLGAYWP